MHKLIVIIFNPISAQLLRLFSLWMLRRHKLEIENLQFSIFAPIPVPHMPFQHLFLFPLLLQKKPGW